jgi:hypothetical protein
MSIEPEDSVLEEALRGDLPSSDAEARLRRRLLAAGVAVGNGVATTTAVASGTASAGASGLVTKVAGLSWGLKLGLAAAVSIPTLGLWLDGHAARRAAVQVATAPSPARALPARQRAIAAEPAAPIRAAEPEPLAAKPERPALRGVRPALADVAAPASDSTPNPAHPSQSDFAALEPPARTPQIASTLADETRLLDGAFAELARGNRARAAELIGEHEARYPSGLLQKERQRAKARLLEMSRGE